MLPNGTVRGYLEQISIGSMNLIDESMRRDMLSPRLRRRFMRDIWAEILEDFASFETPPTDLRVTNRRFDNETTADFRRARRLASPRRCVCGASIPLSDTGRTAARCAPCGGAKSRKERDAGRKR